MNSLALELTLDIGLAAATALHLRREVSLPRRLEWNLSAAVDAPTVGLCDAVLQTVADALAGQGLQVKGEAPPLQLPMPWARVCGASPRIPTQQDQCQMAAAHALGLTPADASDWCACLDALRGHGESLAEVVREAAVFWLVSEGRLADATPETEYWNQDRREVLVLRNVELPRRSPRHPLLQHGYQLLHGLVGLHQNPAPALDDYAALLDGLTIGGTVPLACQQALWWEANYRLSETGRFSEANKALAYYQQAATALAALLPGLAGRDGLGVGVALGRQAYYQGCYDRALTAYRKEWEAADAFRKPRIKRLVAGVLSDMFYLDAASRLAQDAASEEHNIQNSVEAYKSAGRWGEVEIRSGNYAEARRYYLLSLDLQKKRFDAGQIDGQTHTYLGHVALLEGHPDIAEAHYAKAQAADMAFNPYTLMGQIALAVRRQDTASAQAAYEKHQDGLKAMADDLVKALPIAVIAAGLYLLSPEKYEKEAQDALKKLIQANYAIESLYLLRLLHTPARAKPHAQAIDERLQTWSQAILKLPQEWRSDESDTCRPTPANLQRALAKALKNKNSSWAALDAYLPFIFPMNLLGCTEPGSPLQIGPQS